MKIKIKVGTDVGQDFKYFKWPGVYPYAVDVVFEVKKISDTRISCKADGFGSEFNYGNGPIYMNGSL